MQLQFLIHKQYIRRNDTNKVVSDSKNYLEAYFMFSPDWDYVNKTAVFSDGENCYEVLIINNECKVPHEVIKSPEFTVSVFGGNLITTNKATVNVIESGLGPNPPEPPTEDIYSQILDLTHEANNTSKEAKQIAQSIEERANSGEFNGKNGTNFIPFVSESGTISWTNEDGLPNPQSVNIRGPQGVQGKPGLTPYIGSNHNWWIGNEDTGYQAVIDDSQIDKLTEDFEKLQNDFSKIENDFSKVENDFSKIEEQFSSIQEEVVTKENVTDVVNEVAKKVIVEEIGKHNENMSAHKELIDQATESTTWKTMDELLK